MTTKRVIACFVFCAVVTFTVSAFAANGNYILTKRGVIVKHPPKKVVTPSQWQDPGLTTIASTLSTYEFAVFFPFFNYYVTGPDNKINVPEYWEAVPFKPAANIKAMEVEAGVEWAEGTNEVVLALYSDSSGLPGKALHTWHIKNLAGFGTCCQLAVGKYSAGVPLTKGTQYWLVAKTDSSDTDIFAGWTYNTTDMRSHPWAEYCSGTSSQCGSNNGKWYGVSGVVPSFAVLGK